MVSGRFTGVNSQKHPVAALREAALETTISMATPEGLGLVWGQRELTLSLVT